MVAYFFNGSICWATLVCSYSNKSIVRSSQRHIWVLRAFLTVHLTAAILEKNALIIVGYMSRKHQFWSLIALSKFKVPCSVFNLTPHYMYRIWSVLKQACRVSWYLAPKLIAFDRLRFKEWITGTFFYMFSFAKIPGRLLYPLCNTISPPPFPTLGRFS